MMTIAKLFNHAYAEKVSHISNQKVKIN